MNNKLLFATVLLSLIASTQTVDWQGYGNMSSSNLTDIWTFINSKIGAAVTSGKYSEFSQELSDHLNSLWDPAWNIVTVISAAQKDTVLYGYAFREHWMWYNGYIVSDKILAFVIWKDYNCKNWANVGQVAAQTTFSNAQLNQINEAVDETKGPGSADIWKIAKDFMNALKAKFLFSGDDRAYSIVISQGDSKDIQMYARFCLAGSNHAHSSMDSSWGKFILFQTRS